MLKKNVYLLLLILIASFALIDINYYTIKILSALRSYIHGESEYSKGQKDALTYLYAYIETEDPAYITSFNESLQVPMADNMARQNLLSSGDDHSTAQYFLTGRNHQEDIPDMIWLFKTFRTTYMRMPIQIWNDAEPLINQLHFIGNDIQDKINKKSLTDADKRIMVKKISSLSVELSVKESNFSKVLGDIARKIKNYLFIANVLCILIIIGSLFFYVWIMVRRLTTANEKLEATNKEVIETGKELDTLIYSVSHDLRSPITSIQGLLNLLKGENNIEMFKEYTGYIESTIKKQDIFILEIIDFFKNKRSVLSFNEFSLKALIDEVLNNNRFTPIARNINISRDIRCDIVYTDPVRVKMIINNLLSNAIKYSDEKKEEMTIAISTYKEHHNFVIEIADNGVGIDKKHIDKIYNMFYVTSNVNKGTGLGLYILKQNIEKLHGKVEVHSEVHVGTKFTVHIPFATASHIQEHAIAESLV